jgi:hypothetical protein
LGPGLFVRGSVRRGTPTEAAQKLDGGAISDAHIEKGELGMKGAATEGEADIRREAELGAEKGKQGAARSGGRQGVGVVAAGEILDKAVEGGGTWR